MFGDSLYDVLSPFDTQAVYVQISAIYGVLKKKCIQENTCSPTVFEYKHKREELLYNLKNKNFVIGLRLECHFCN